MILGVTAVRAGSKGVPRKNIRPMCGRPLIAWTIEAARASRLLDRYIVSTEDSELAEVAQALGAEVLRRPVELATDEVLMFEVLQHVLDHIPADIVVLLQATSPIRNAGLIDRCIERFREAEADSLATGFICKYKPYGQNTLRRQDIEGFFCDDGNVYVLDADVIRGGRVFGRRIERVVLDREQNVDIDEEFDFWLAEQVLAKRQARARGVGARP